METKQFVAFPCRPYFIWEMNTEADVIEFIRSSSKTIAETLRAWGCDEAVFRTPESKPVKLPVELIEEMEPIAKLFYAHVSLPPAVIRATLDMIDRPRKVGISRASDGLQIVMSSLCQELNPGHTMSEATTWTRDKFWHPGDLERFNHDARQQLNLDGSNVLEFRWRSFDPALGMSNRTPGNWLQFVTRYSLIDGEDGQVYQICENVAMSNIELPKDLVVEQ